MKLGPLPLFLVILIGEAGAATTFNETWNVSTVIPDNDDTGYSNSQVLEDTGISSIQSVTVNLTFTGGWNGDLFAYLVHDSGYAVLLNRVGRDGSQDDGAGSSGMTVDLSDLAAADIHTAIPMTGGAVTGTFQPSGRETDPFLTLDTDPRSAMLSSFSGGNADGTWTLFVADQSGGGTSTLQSWSMTITGVPEPSSLALGVPAMMLLVFSRSRKRKD